MVPAFTNSNQVSKRQISEETHVYVSPNVGDHERSPRELPSMLLKEQSHLIHTASKLPQDAESVLKQKGISSFSHLK